jgi:tetratricopeptide (TPR) repeat protein
MAGTATTLKKKHAEKLGTILSFISYSWTLFSVLLTFFLLFISNDFRTFLRCSINFGGYGNCEKLNSLLAQMTTLREKSQYDDAANLAKEVLKIDSQNHFAYRSIGHAMYTRGDYNLAIENYRKAVEFNKSDYIDRKI